MTALQFEFPRTKGLFAKDCYGWSFEELCFVDDKGLGGQWHELNKHWTCCGKEGGQPGTYVFILDGRVMYVGSTMNLGARINSKHKARSALKGQGGRLIIKARHGDVRTGDFLAREYRLIRRFKPPLNRQYVGL